MNSFSEFFNKLLQKANISLERDLDIAEIRFIISQINEYFYTNYEGIGQTHILDAEFEYFSEFHKFWENYHREILNPRIDETQCEKAADVLHNIYVNFGEAPFYELYDTFSLGPEEICKIRYFSANQEFRGTRNFQKLFRIHGDDPSVFDKDSIKESPEDFLNNIGITSLSQNDKRVKYASIAAQLLIDRNIDPHQLIDYCNNDINRVRELLLSNRGSGFGNKKTDMFLRDMVVLGVWENPDNFDRVDVASDINTVKVALRSGLLKTDIVLLSSFLDIFCYQYGLIDEMNALAWRQVWEIWNRKFSGECIESPSLIDYFIYRVIGRDFCKESLCLFECETGEHTFRWHSARNRTCQECYKNGVKRKATVVAKFLPCTDDEGHLVIESSKFVRGESPLLPGIKECPFVPVCDPRAPQFRKVNPPKSISILGKTGWETARARKGEGGGGLMA